MLKNNALLGFVLGLLAPVFGFLLVFVLLHQDIPLAAFLKGLMQSHTNAAKVLSLSILTNLIPFFYYYNRRADQTAKGVLSATILFALLRLPCIMALLMHSVTEIMMLPYMSSSISNDSFALSIKLSIT